MLNKLWSSMILLGIVWALVNGKMTVVTQQILESAQSAVQLGITMFGVVSMWTGVLKVAEKADLLNVLTKLFHPFFHWMFPHIPQNHLALEYMSVNIMANMLGLGGAATPAGLKAMEELEKLEEERRTQSLPAQKKGVASNEMCTFFILNISSLQLISVNLIVYRMQYESANPTIVVGPAFLVTAVGTVVGILFCKMMEKKLHKKM